MEITFFQMPSMLTALVTLALGVFVYVKNSESILNRTFFLLCLSVTVWQAGNCLSWSSLTSEECEFWGRALYLGVAMISSFYYHFSVEFNSLDQRRKFIPVFYLMDILLVYLVFREDFIIGSYDNVWGRHILIGPGHIIFLGLWFIPMLFAFFNFYHGYRYADSSFQRQRRKYLIVCYAISGLACIDFLPSYGIRVLFPFGFVPILFFAASTTYAIVRYRILDIRIILKRVSFITFLAIFTVLLIYITPFYFQEYFKKVWGGNWIYFPVSLAFIIGLVLIRVVNLIRSVEGVELSKRYTYRPILRKEAERFSKVKNINELLSFLTRDLSSWIRLGYVGIFVWDNNLKKFILLRSLSRAKSIRRIPAGMMLSADDPIVLELIRQKKALLLSELKFYLDNQNLPFEQIQQMAKLTGQMQSMGAEVTVPCFCEDKLLAIVNMGKKLERYDLMTSEDLELFSSLSGHIARTINGFMLHEEKINLIVASQNILITAIEAKDSYTRGHTDRVAKLSALIGQRMDKLLRHYSNGLSNLRWAAQLHDIGKIGIPDSILLKKGPLSEEEWKVIKEHPVNGINIINPMREWLGDDVCCGILHHHENYDGTGYPAQRKGDEIHLFAQIIRIADAFDAMIISRPYRHALDKEKIIGEIIKFKGRYFAPHIVNVLLELYNEGEI